MNARSTLQDVLRIVEILLVGSLVPVKLDIFLEKIHDLALVSYNTGNRMEIHIVYEMSSVL